MKNLRITEAKIGENSFSISPIAIESDSSNHISVVIGNNATGKSRLLTSMLNCLRQGANPRLRSNVDDTELTIHVDGKLIDIKKENPGPSQDINLISISNSIFDKFPHQVKSDINYTYVGVKPIGIGAHRKAITNDLMDTLSSHLGDSSFRRKTYELFDFIGLGPVINVSLRGKHQSNEDKITDLLWNNSSLERLSEYLAKISTQAFYRQQHNKIKEHLADVSFMTGFHAYLSNEFADFVRGNRRHLRYKIDLLIASENNNFIEEYKYFSLLRKLNLLTYDSIEVYKHKSGKSYDINDSSTGEIGLLTTFIRATPHLKPNSIIFVDEPEISLHPSWQMQYIGLLQKFLEGYTNCHVIIATHSHLILSDLENEWGSVLTLRTGEGNQVISNLRPFTPYGWSPEAILYEVFGVVTVRNQHFEFELAKMLRLISHDSDDIQEIQKFIDKFNSFKFSESDPLNLLIANAKEYVANKH